MIDNKKIVDVAKQHSEESYISGYFQACYKDAFTDGAKWMQEEFLKNLWHPASKKPLLQNGKCLVVYNSGKVDIFSISFVYEMLSNYGKDGMDWKFWAYVSDLFPKEGGDQ